MVLFLLRRRQYAVRVAGRGVPDAGFPLWSRQSDGALAEISRVRVSQKKQRGWKWLARLASVTAVLPGYYGFLMSGFLGVAFWTFLGGPWNL